MKAIPTWLILVLIVLSSFAVRAYAARGMFGPFVMPDELIYAELSKSFAESATFALRDVPVAGYPMLYPVVISPAYLLNEDLEGAYAAVKTINALLMSFAAVPAYLLARRVVHQWLALVAAALTVAMPALAYTATVMTENLFYPIGLFVAFLLVRVLEHPTWFRSGLLLAVLACAYATRVQGLVLAAAIITAPLAQVALERGAARRLIRYWRLYVSLAILACAFFVLQLLRGEPFENVLGAYGVVAEVNYNGAAALRSWSWHLMELVLAVGIVPAAALLLLIAIPTELDERLREHLAATLVFIIWVTGSTAMFAARFAVPERILERSTFFLAPLLFVCLVTTVGSPMGRRLRLRIGASALCLSAVGLLPYERLIGDPVRADTFTLIPIWNELDNMLFGSVVLTIFLAGATITLPFVFLSRHTVAVPLVLLLTLATASASVWSGAHGVRTSGARALFQGVQAVPRDWIDRAVPKGDSVVVLYSGVTDRFTVNQNEFFNRRVGRVVYTKSPELGGETLGSIGGAVDKHNGAVIETSSGQEIDAGYLLTDGTTSPDGRLLRRDTGTSMGLWKVARPLRITKTAISGWYEDLWSGPTLRWSLKRCRGGSLTVTLSGDAQLFPNGQTVTAAGGRRIRVPAPPLGPVSLRVPLRSIAGSCTAVFSVTPTAVPRDVLGVDDDRRLGTHFTGFIYEPAR